MQQKKKHNSDSSSLGASTAADGIQLGVPGPIQTDAFWAYWVDVPGEFQEMRVVHDSCSG